MADSKNEWPFRENLDLEIISRIAELSAERDTWRMHAQLSENHLNRILQSPAWKLTKPFRILNLIAWKLNPKSRYVEKKSWEPKKSGQTVFELVRSSLVIEENNADHNAAKIALFAHWSSREVVSLSTQILVSNLLDSGYQVILISACESPAPLVIDAKIKERITIVRKANLGYDFGSWSTGIQLFPEVVGAEHVIIVNDSLIGPFDDSFSEIIEELESAPFDLTGISDSIQMRHHIQSYLIHFKQEAFAKPAIQKFWKEIYLQDEKMDVVEAYEIGLTATAQANKLFVGALFPWNLVGQYWQNPSVDNWERLLDLGFPFIKREVARESREAKNKSLIPKIEKRFSVSEALKFEVIESKD